MSVPQMQLVDWLDDLSVRFIVNLPKEELQSIERICFQVEEAQWFYEDFVRPTNPQLPSMNLKQFLLAIFHHCPLFAGYNPEIYMQAFQEFLAYKNRVPVRGAILLNDAMDEVVLVRGWKKTAGWSFPRGKINKAEDDLDCAIREVFEETGLDLNAAGLIPGNKDVKSIDITLREQSIKLFVIPSVPKDTHFEPQTRKEIGSIQWYKLADLPTLKRVKNQNSQHREAAGENLASHANKFYMVAPFLGPLRKIIAYHRKLNTTRLAAGAQGEVTNAYNSSVQLDPLGGPSVANGATGGLGNSESTDMDRLLGQLRQSKEAQRDMNLPEALQPTILGLDGLPVQSQPQIQTQVQPQPQPQFQTQQLHTGEFDGLYPGSANTTPYPNHTGGMPYHQSRQRSAEIIPLEHANPRPIIPPSPEPPYQPQAIYPDRVRMAPPTLSYPPGTVQQPHQMFPGMQQQQPVDQRQMQASLAPQPPWLAAASAAPTRPRSPAPYHQTGDADFSIHAHPQGQSAPAVPEPNRLPPPKLTANSAKLLSLFKSPVAAPATVAMPAAEMSADSRSHGPSAAVDIQTNQTVPPVNYRRKSPASLSLAANTAKTPDIASPTELGINSPVASRPRTSQQNTLLDLFKARPSRGAGALSPALAPAPSLPPPVELSGAPSPAPWSSFPDRRVGSSEALAPPANGKTSAQRRHRGNVSTSSAMSATVTGPLNVSEQELQQRSIGRGQGHNASASIHRQAPILIPGNVKILSRPGSSNGPRQNVHNQSPAQKQQSPKVPRSPRRTRNEPKSAHQSPTPFQPQILKRPVESSTDAASQDVEASPPQPISTAPLTILRRGAEPTSPVTTPPAQQRTPTIDRGIVEAPSPMSRHTPTNEDQAPVSAVTPGPSQGMTTLFDRRTSQTSEQKASLLSLFGGANKGPAGPSGGVTSNPAPLLMGSNVTTPTASMLPPATMQVSISQPAISPLSVAHPRTRMGSMASVGSGDSAVGRHTPQTTNEKDKKFLLGFLNNVAQGKGN